MKRLLVSAFLFALSLATTPATAADKEWTFLLYLNGNNNLDSFGKLNLNQMEAVGSSDSVNLVAEWASLENGDTRRLLIKKDSDSVNVTSPALQNLGQTDMGDAKTLEDFIRWGITAYPAKHYFVAVWDHGSGWRARVEGAGAAHVNDISWDDNSGHSITTKQLGAVMTNVSSWLGRKIDIYGSDACMMGMAEVAGEMKNSVNYFVGSQDLEPGAGWPYTEFLAPLIANPQMSAHDLSARLTSEYALSYNGGSNGKENVTMASYDMAQYGAVQNALAKLSSEVQKMPDAARAKVFSAAKAAQAFDYNDYVDLGDFLKQITALDIREIDAKVIADANAALNQFVVLSANTGTFAAATGASIWIPKDTEVLGNYLTTYKTLQWDSDTHWSDALSDIVK
ncbi:MAG: clostripain-related cysteine peptidase [Bdellovibrionota bacterium]